MKRKAWLLLAVVPVLLGTYTLKRSLIPAPASGGETSVAQPARPDSSRKPSRDLDAVTASQSPSQKSLSADLDPFAVLDRQFAARRKAETARFAEMEASLKARIQPALDASAAKHQRDMENLKEMNLSAEQKNQWLKQLSLQYDKNRLEIKGTIQPDLEGLTTRRTEASEKLEAERAEKHTRLQEIETMAENGQMDPVAAKRAQFEILGVALPDSAFQAGPGQSAQAEAAAAPSPNGVPAVAAIMETSDNRFCALIEDALMYEGGTVRGYRVRKIQADSVEFEKDGQTWVQKVN